MPPSGAPVPRYLLVPKTARYWTLGPESGAAEVWFVLHGYGQLALDFLKNFEVLDDGSRLFVAPEALSRFYHKEGRGPVGASWMTREERESEIGDYVGYLDHLYRHILGANGTTSVPPGPARAWALGFSQGLATALRWAALGRSRLDHLILWAGGLPNDLDLAAARTALAGTRITLAGGARDKVVPEGAMIEAGARLNAAGISSQLVRFDGGHRLDREVLRAMSEP